jgi:hypothetical protein
VRLVVDTNVVVSGLLWKGPPHALLEAARRYRDILLYASPRLLAELADVLGRKKLAIAAAAGGQPPEASMQRYLQVAHMVVPAAIGRRCRPRRRSHSRLRRSGAG